MSNSDPQTPPHYLQLIANSGPASGLMLRCPTPILKPHRSSPSAAASLRGSPCGAAILRVYGPETRWLPKVNYGCVIGDSLVMTCLRRSGPTEISPVNGRL